jgi:hypothetical protein
LGEDRFHRAGASVVNEPFDLGAGPEAFLEPAFTLAGKIMRYQALSVSDVWKMTHPQNVLSACRASEGQGHGDYQANRFHNRPEIDNTKRIPIGEAAKIELRLTD